MTFQIKIGSLVTFALPAGVVITCDQPSVIKVTMSGSNCTVEAVSTGNAKLKGTYADLFGGFLCTVVS